MINDGVKIVSLTEQISLIAKETTEDFIIETIEPYCSEVAEIKISKEELKKIILKNYGTPNQEPCKNCTNKEFIEIVVNYPPADLCVYPEYKGKPYYSIKYRENGKEYYTGFGTYKIEILSQWIKEYFITGVQPKTDVLDKIRAEIHATAEMHEDGDYYLRDEWIDEIINKYKTESEGKE